MTYQKSLSSNTLITPEITRQLELVNHLLVNSQQALIISGPNGIGKSTFVTILQTHHKGSWLYCVIEANTSLRFEKILGQLLKIINQEKASIHYKNLRIAFRQFENKNRKIVLIIDNASQLEAGLINTLIDAALNNSVLRVIFVLTNDELDSKISSDLALDDSFLIEIEPFTKDQCSRFLQGLASLPQPRLALSEINDEYLDAIYLQSQGIPGKIVAGLPTDETTVIQSSESSLKILIAAVIVLIILALMTQWLTGMPRSAKLDDTVTDHLQETTTDTLK